MHMRLNCFLGWEETSHPLCRDDRLPRWPLQRLLYTFSINREKDKLLASGRVIVHQRVEICEKKNGENGAIVGERDEWEAEGRV